jgi:parvulin-like peptidyl-prolyl isomerase
MLQYAFRIQPRRFEEESRQNIILSKLFKMLTDDIQASDEEVRQEYRKANEKIRLIYIAALPSEFAKNINPSAEEIKDYFVKNSLKFKRPPSLNLEYIVLEPDAKSKGAIKRLAKKGSFHRVAKDLNLPVKETGVFAQTELIPGLGWSAEILPLVTKLKPGQHTAPIQIDKQLYVFCVKEKLDAYLPELEKVQDGVKITLVQEESQGLAKNKIEECLKKIRELQQEGAKDIDFNKAAGEFGLKSGPTEPFGYGSYIEGIGASDIFWDTASKLQNGEVSGVLAVPGGFYIIKVKERMPIDENKFSSEKTDFSRKVLLQKKQEYFVKFLADLKKK